MPTSATSRRSASVRAFLATIVNPKALTVYLVVMPGVGTGAIMLLTARA